MRQYDRNETGSIDWGGFSEILTEKYLARDPAQEIVREGGICFPRVRTFSRMCESSLFFLKVFVCLLYFLG